MLPPEELSLRRKVLTRKVCQLWTATRPVDRQRYGQMAASHLSLLNTGDSPLRIQRVELSWLTMSLSLEKLTGVVEPGTSQALLDERSFDTLMALTRQHGRRGFGMEGVVHRALVQLDRPKPVKLAFEVSWGFVLPDDHMGFFLPALAGEGPYYSTPRATKEALS